MAKREQSRQKYHFEFIYVHSSLTHRAAISDWQTSVWKDERRRVAATLHERHKSEFIHALHWKLNNYLYIGNTSFNIIQSAEEESTNHPYEGNVFSLSHIQWQRFVFV